MLEIVEKLESKLKVIDDQMIQPEILSDQKRLIGLTRERRTLESILETARRYRQAHVAVDEANEIVASSDDEELIAMAKEELETSQTSLEELEQELKMKLLPQDPNDGKAAVVEIRAGTGGDEAGLFAADLFRMYQRFADKRNWKIEVMNSHASEMGGFKEIIFTISGDVVFGQMKYESGVHRVQRVPVTETQGRIHTSAVTVAVFPEAEEVDIVIKENEIKVDVYRSSGPGGQSVNTTDSAVRITYLPTGLVVTCQDEKSQLKNRNKAMKVLRARLYDQILSEQQAKVSAERRLMISSGDRSAKIRTYNYPQSRVTDHRIKLTVYKLDQVLGGDVDLLIDPLRLHDQEKQLQLETQVPQG